MLYCTFLQTVQFESYGIGLWRHQKQNSVYEFGGNADVLHKRKKAKLLLPHEKVIRGMLEMRWLKWMKQSQA
jgi:hypothetical protein